MRQKGIHPEIEMPDEKVERMLSPSAVSRVFGNIVSNAPVSYTHLDVYKRQLLLNMVFLKYGYTAAVGLDHIEDGFNRRCFA